MQLQVVSIRDVFPDKNNPRKTFEGIDELAASFDLNSERPGEPFTPPILVQDGGIYRIIDGERRYRALKKRKATSFTANVCTDMDEANTVMAMLATDDKQPLSELEKSQGVQTMLLLGVDPVKVEKAAKIKDAAKVKRALDVVDDAAEDMTLDRMIAIAELADDEAAVEKLTNCSEKEWQQVYRGIIEDREHAAAHEALTDAIDEMNIPIYDGRPEGYNFAIRVSTPENVAGFFEDHEPADFIAVDSSTDWSVAYSLFTEAIDEEDSRASRERAELDALSEQVEESESRRMVFYLSMLNSTRAAGGYPAAIMKTAQLVVDEIKESGFYESIAAIDEEFEMNFASRDFDDMALVSFASRAFHIGGIRWPRALINGTTDEWNIQRYCNYVGVIDAFLADGYQPEAWEVELFERIRAVKVEGSDE